MERRARSSYASGNNTRVPLTADASLKDAKSKLSTTYFVGSRSIKSKLYHQVTTNSFFQVLLSGPVGSGKTYLLEKISEKMSSLSRDVLVLEDLVKMLDNDWSLPTGVVLLLDDVDTLTPSQFEKLSKQIIMKEEVKKKGGDLRRRSFGRTFPLSWSSKICTVWSLK